MQSGGGEMYLISGWGKSIAHILKFRAYFTKRYCSHVQVYSQSMCISLVFKICLFVYEQVEWSQSRFNDVMQKMKIFLKQAGFKVCCIAHTPA